MATLTTRQERLLGLIVRKYVETARKSGVSSKRLVDEYGLGLSSATVRNEMATLTRAGLLNQPYTSAGRIPTETGYRYFVRRLVEADAVEQQSHLVESGVQRTLLAQIVASMRRADSFAAGEVYVDGLQNVLAEREFADSAPARKALRLPEKRTFLEGFLASALSPQISGVQSGLCATSPA